MNKVSADLYSLALVMELAKSGESGFSSAVSGSSEGYAKYLAAFISTLSNSLQAEIHDHVDIAQVQKLIRNSSGQ